jgi:hypothetical protein
MTGGRRETLGDRPRRRVIAGVSAGGTEKARHVPGLLYLHLLVRAVSDEATRLGRNEIDLYAREETREFYEKLGFASAGVELRKPLMDQQGRWPDRN